MVNSDKEHEPSHVPSDVIVDASMPAMICTPRKCGIKTVSIRYTRKNFSNSDRSYAGILYCYNRFL
jgi:monomeric isocitrate dehydrogenase